MPGLARTVIPEFLHLRTHHEGFLPTCATPARDGGGDAAH
jgi:hypothetical protein